MRLFSSITGFNATQAKVYEHTFSKNDSTDYSEVDYCNKDFDKLDGSNVFQNSEHNFTFDDEPSRTFDISG